MEKKDYKKMSKSELIRRLKEMDRKPGYSVQQDTSLHTGTASMFTDFTKGFPDPFNTSNTFPPFFTQN
jgi:hypothetical protein